MKLVIRSWFGAVVILALGLRAAAPTAALVCHARTVAARTPSQELDLFTGAVRSQSTAGHRVEVQDWYVGPRPSPFVRLTPESYWTPANNSDFQPLAVGVAYFFNPADVLMVRTSDSGRCYLGPASGNVQVQVVVSRTDSVEGSTTRLPKISGASRSMAVMKLTDV